MLGLDLFTQVIELAHELVNLRPKPIVLALYALQLAAETSICGLGPRDAWVLRRPPAGGSR